MVDWFIGMCQRQISEPNGRDICVACIRLFAHDDKHLH